MAGINSRKKGNKNERTAAAMVSTWTGRKFARTPSSGGLQWKASFVKGDIICSEDSHYCPLCFEIKAHKEIDFSHLLNPKIKNVKILEFWAQCTRDAEKCKKLPILMMRYDNMPKDFFFIGIPLNFWATYHSNNGLEVMDFTTIKYRGRKDRIAFLRSDEFLSIPYKNFRIAAKIYLKSLYKNGKTK